MIKTMRGLINAIYDADCVRDRMKEGPFLLFIYLCYPSTGTITYYNC